MQVAALGRPDRVAPAPAAPHGPHHELSAGEGRRAENGAGQNAAADQNPLARPPQNALGNRGHLNPTKVVAAVHDRPPVLTGFFLFHACKTPLAAGTGAENGLFWKRACTSAFPG